VLSPVPGLYRGSELRPDDPEDPYVFRTEFPLFGGGTSRAVFSRDPMGGVGGLHFDAAPMSFRRRRAPSRSRGLAARASPPTP